MFIRTPLFPLCSSSSYYDQMCGLCGDYDGNPNNDFTKPDGSLVDNVNDFGNSWQTKEDEDERCTQGSKPEPDCDPSLEEELVKPDKCGKIEDPTGPFRDCIAVVDPTSFFKSCVYDMCQFNGQHHVLCDQLQAYTDACQSAGATVHQWRTPDFCPLACPPNSSYSLCVSSCPETCLGVAGPPGCEDVCVEGCECNPGFILSDDRCVAFKDCGCVDASGTYYPVSETKGKARSSNCRPGTESCQLHNGQYECRPLGNGICSVSGDPHYTTFDKETHNYMGACSYTLTKPCNESSGLPYFTVDTINEHRGSNKKVSYVRAVVVNVKDVTFILGKGRKVQVNGTLVVPPVTSINGVQIYLSGKFVVLETSFGLRVRFDGNHHADVSVPTSYSGLLCGNFNGEPEDDNLKPDNTAASNTNDLGDSWQVPDPRMVNVMLTGSLFLISSSGIFKPCHSVVPPESFFENCVYDLCATGGQTVALCQAIESYADMCAAAGVPIHWRDNTFCRKSASELFLSLMLLMLIVNGILEKHCCDDVLKEDKQQNQRKNCGKILHLNNFLQVAFSAFPPPAALKCPAGSHYEPCTSACPQPSCQDPAGPGGSCKHPCVEGCVCNEGLVLSGDKCVPLSECGCTDEDGKYRPVGDTWFTETDCSERCKCNGNLNVTCEPWRCSPAQECKVVEGVLGCHSTVCHVAGDPHYYTFDGVMHTFMGTCTYTLVEVCNSSMVTPFKVVAKNEERGQPEASYVRYVKVYLPHDTEVELQKGPGAKVITSGSYILLDTNFGLQVKFDGVHHLEVTVPGEYFNKVCGMCGNYNHDNSDDNLMPDKRPAKDVIELGNSWKSDGDKEENLYTAQCAEVIMSDRFKPCHSLVPPEAFLGNCIYDMCEYDGMQATLCDNVEAFAQACHSAGVTISWRNNTFCPLPCPTNSHYSDCTPPCPPTCSDLFPIFCHLPPTTCVEGCQCNAGYVLSDDKCVALDKCGCYPFSCVQVGDSWLTDKCSESCTCNLGGGITCKSHSCNSNSVCALDKNGDVYCQPSKFDRCSITGDPHYRTFDSFKHHFQGANTYILTQGHNLLDSQVSLLVRGKNIRRGLSKRVSVLDQMYVDVYGVSVRFLQKNVVNGERVTPPLSPVRGLTITMNSKEVQLSTDFGLTVRFDGKIQIELPSTYRHSVRGLCGNYDGITGNEYMKPDGTVVRSLNEFGESWRTNDREAGGLKISDVQKAVHVHSDYNSVKKCGALSDPQGPFVACHDIVEPQPYQDDCLFDLCAEEGSEELRCGGYEAYATACQEAGVELGAWRQNLNCALTCGANSSYSQCMTACPSSCGDLAAPSECDITSCVEGCQCASGFVMSEGICVPYPECGCTFLNRYYPLKEKFVTEDCSQSCECTSRGAVCQPKSCQEGYVCTIFDLKRDCFKGMNFNPTCHCKNGMFCFSLSTTCFSGAGLACSFNVRC
uniref:VWFD domain-containing protein n=1 Tax=Poecilia reticulata TaxID=8081 RepID=A0A3P9N5B4_POERE